MLAEITDRALLSSVYAGRISRVSSFEELGKLPLTTYEQIQHHMAEHGKDRVLLAPSVVAFRTSGSTGSPKEFFYGQADLERIMTEYRHYSHIIGIRSHMRGWNLAGAPPDVSGYILDQLRQDLMVEATTSLLRNDQDLIGALKSASKMERIDLVCSAALVVYLVGRMSREPDFLPDLVIDKIVRTYHLPRPLAKLAASIYLRKIDREAMKAFADNVSIGISFAESLDTYRAELDRCYPNLKIFDIYGSTENPIMASQIVQGSKGLGLLNGAIIAELIPSDDLRISEIDPDDPPKAVPWYEWEAGMKGELVITRPGECLPLVRYPTGDIIEVLHPWHTDRVDVLGTEVDITLPQIRVLGRTADTLDYDAHDEAGNFMGVKIYSRFVNEALHGRGGVRWWELYNIRCTPARLTMVLIPEKEPLDRHRFITDARRRLLEENPDVPQMFEIACDLKRFDIILLPAASFRVIQAEIDRRVREGRSLGQLKPKHIYKVDGMEAFRRLMLEKFEHEIAEPPEMPLLGEIEMLVAKDRA